MKEKVRSLQEEGPDVPGLVGMVDNHGTKGSVLLKDCLEDVRPGTLLISEEAGILCVVVDKEVWKKVYAPKDDFILAELSESKQIVTVYVLGDRAFSGLLPNTSKEESPLHKKLKFFYAYAHNFSAVQNLEHQARKIAEGLVLFTFKLDDEKRKIVSSIMDELFLFVNYVNGSNLKAMDVEPEEEKYLGYYEQLQFPDGLKS